MSRILGLCLRLTPLNGRRASQAHWQRLGDVVVSRVLVLRLSPVCGPRASEAQGLKDVPSLMLWCLLRPSVVRQEAVDHDTLAGV